MRRRAATWEIGAIVRQEKGFSLIELMTAVAITGIIVAAGFTILTSSNKATNTTDQLAGTQQSARLAMELLSRDIKMAGFGSTGAAAGACATPIVPGDNNIAGNDTGPDQVSLLVPATSNAVTSWTLSAQAPTTAGSSFTQIALTTANINDMVSAGMANGSYISLGGTPSVPVSVINAAGGTITFASSIGAPALFPAGTPVYLLQCVTYAISTNAVTCGSAAPCLTRNGQAIAEGVEDLQLAYACDGCVSAINTGVPDGTIDNQGGAAGFDEADFVTNNAWATPPMTPDKIRLVQVSLVARQVAPEMGLSEAQVRAVNTPGPIVVSDHNPSADAGYTLSNYQQWRRRVLVRTVQTRNLGL
jgi:type IV pilus assembly protein PilW